MRDPGRIPILLAAIERVWVKHPDARLCQLLSNLCRGEPGANGEDLFYVEDDEVLRLMRERGGG